MLPYTSESAANAEAVKAVASAHNRHSLSCHGAGAIGSGVLTDLCFLPIILSEATRSNVEIDLALKDRGFVAFAAELSQTCHQSDIENIGQ